MGLRSLFRPKSPATPATAPRHVELRWLDLDAADAAQHPTAMADIAARRIDGLTVTSVFSADACARAIARLEADRSLEGPAMFGTMLGITLANVAAHSGDPSDRTPYLDDAELVMARYVDAFGADPFERVGGVMSALADGLPAAAPTEGGRPYLAGNVRWMVPGGRALPAHVGNEFQLANPAYAHLASTTAIRDHYSWFVVLQTPEQGGALSVYDLLYEGHEPVDGAWGIDGRDDADFDELPCKKIAPPAGTLILFGGGWRWHRVDRIGGDRPRITYGGFAGRSATGDQIHAWS